MFFLGIDPGFTTGIALVQCSPKRMNLIRGIYTLSFNSMLNEVDVAKDVRLFLEAAVDSQLVRHPVYVAIEDFVGGTGGSEQSVTNRVIGAVHYALNTSSVFPNIQFQRNFERKHFQAKASSLAPKGSLVHAKDALAHVLARMNLVAKGQSDLHWEVAVGARIR